MTSHSLRAGANTDMKRGGATLAQRNEAGDWKGDLADTAYDRPDETAEHDETDPLDLVPPFGRFEQKGGTGR